MSPLQKNEKHMQATLETLTIHDVGAQRVRIRTDAEAIHACQNGSTEAFGFLVKRYMQRGYYSALGIVAIHEAALDLSQDAFVRAFSAIKKFDTNKSFFTWYYQILRNLCFNYLRDTKKHARSFSELPDYQIDAILDTQADTDAAVMQDETKRNIWKAMNQLRPIEREVLVLKEFEELSYKEIAEVLCIPIGTVMSRLYNARHALKEKLERIYL